MERESDDSLTPEPEEEFAPNRPVETGESDTGNKTEPGMEAEQEEPGRSGEEAPAPQNQEEPEQQPISCFIRLIDIREDQLDPSLPSLQSSEAESAQIIGFV